MLWYCFGRKFDTLHTHKFAVLVLTSPPARKKKVQVHKIWLAVAAVTKLSLGMWE